MHEQVFCFGVLYAKVARVCYYCKLLAWKTREIITGHAYRCLLAASNANYLLLWIFGFVKILAQISMVTARNDLCRALLDFY